MEVPSAAEPLLSLPPSRFTAERNALASALADRGDPAAGAVRKVPRPVGLAWLMNRLARERPREVEALLAAGDRLRAGQRRALSGAGAGELREADEELRARARTLRSEAERIVAAEGRPAAAPALARLELLLRVTAPLPGPAREALARGVLLREPEIASGELAGFAVLPGGRASPRAAAAPRTATARRAAAAPSAARSARDGRRRREEEREARARAERERRTRERLLAQARRRARAAAARAERDERAASAAAGRARVAAERAARSRAEAERLSATVRALEGPA